MMVWPFQKRSHEQEPRPVGPVGVDDESAADLFGGGDGSPITVNYKTALRSTAVYAAVRTLSEIMASLSIHLYQRVDEGGKQRADKHPAEKVVASFANGFTSAVLFREQMTADFLLHGNAFAIVIRNGKKEVKELHRVDPTAVTIRRNDALEPQYEVTEKGGRKRVYSFRDVIHLRGLSHDNLKGESPITLGKEAIRLSLTLEKHGVNFFQNGARPSGVIEYAKTFGLKGLKNFLKTFRAQHAGAAKSGEPLILDDGMSWKSFELSSADAQYLELRKFSVLEIARLFRLPPHFLAELERTTHSNAEEMGAQLVTYCILPLARKWESELSLKLLSEDERDEYFFEFILDTLMRASTKDRYEAIFKSVGGPWRVINEARALDNMGKIDGGDVLRSPLNIAPVAEEKKPDGEE